MNKTMISLFFLMHILSSSICGTNWQEYWNLVTPCYTSTTRSSRMLFRNYLKKTNYKSLLEIPCGKFTDYEGLQNDGITIDYHGMDILPSIIELGITKNIPCTIGSVEDIPLDDKSFDCVYCRHLLECLPYYHRSIHELIRVAQYEVIIIFFQAPHKDKDIIREHEMYGFCNTYNIDTLSNFVLSISKVQSILWEDVPNSPGEKILHIYLKTS